jgi:hypothetical protein
MSTGGRALVRVREWPSNVPDLNNLNIEIQAIAKILSNSKSVS